MNTTFLRAAAAAVTMLGSAAGVVTANPDLIKTVLPPSVAGAVTLVSLILVAVLHELAHNTAPADPVSLKEPTP